MPRVLVIILALFLVACDSGEVREPYAAIAIVVLEKPGEYILDGKHLYESELKNGLQVLADKYRRKGVDNSRAYVRVAYSPKVAYYRVDDVIGLCASVGLDKVTTMSRAEDPQNAP
jgi:hypothetical protein